MYNMIQVSDIGPSWPSCIIFIVLMKKRISSEYVPRMKVLIFADLMCYIIVIAENTPGPSSSKRR